MQGTADVRRLIRDLVLVEIVAIAIISFAYFVWPYPPLVWEVSYEAFNGVTPITVMMAGLAWMLVGYVAFLLAQWVWGLRDKSTGISHAQSHADREEPEN